MPNVTGKIRRDKLLIKIKEYIQKDIFDVRYAESETCEVRDPKQNTDYRYVMKYFHWCKRIVIWNIHADKCVLHQSIEDIQLQYDLCKVFYEKRRNGNIDKILVIHEDFLLDFLDDYDAFMRYNENDIDGEISFKQEIEWKNIEERKKRNVLQKARDYRFREGVLKKYGYQCAICRCDIPQLLEAAHERGYEACNTVTDMVEHGICLCRNHHAMYDKKDDNGVHLIDIDLKNCTIKINDERIMKMPWYIEFCDENKYAAKLMKPIRY
jgi:hypothetical protein